MTPPDGSEPRCAQADSAAGVLGLLRRDRDRVARQLHDRAMQDLTAVSLQLGLLSMNAGDERPELPVLEADLIAALRELRAVMRGLDATIAGGDARDAFASGSTIAAPSVTIELTGEDQAVCAGCASAYHQLGLGIEPSALVLGVGASAGTITIDAGRCPSGPDLDTMHRHAVALGLAASICGTALQVRDACGLTADRCRASASRDPDRFS